MPTINEVAVQRLHADLKEAASSPKALDRYLQTHGAHIRHIFQEHDMVLDSVQRNAETGSTDPGYWIERGVAEVHCRIAPYVWSAFNAVPHTASGLRSAMSKPK